MRYETFDRSKLILKPLNERKHDMVLSEVIPLDAEPSPFENKDLVTVAERIVAACKKRSAVILMMGAHVIKVGLSRYVIDLMERGIITHVGLNGAGVIHDYELALVGATTESVAKYIRTGEFGMWRETGYINDIIKQGAEKEQGLGETVGEAILDGDFPHKDFSILAAGVRLGIPVTVHVGIGYDIIHQHPNCDGAAWGATSYRDFLIMAQSVTKLEGGVLLNFGTAVMGPEVYLKALSMARNVARQEGRSITKFTTAVFDLIALGTDLDTEAPKDDPRYYYRPFKTILVRTVRDGGESFYIKGDYRITMTNLHRLIVSNKEAGENSLL